MVKFYDELIDSNFQGTIIDIEAIGDFDQDFPSNDSRYYAKILPVIFGYITQKKLRICYVKNKEEIQNLKETIIGVIPTLKKPFYAFHCDFEKGVLFHSCKMKIEFEYELNKEEREWKGKAKRLLEIENYSDPFNDIGYQCRFAWEKGAVNLSVRHNRSCLLKERDILMKRGCRTPDEFVFH